MDPRRVGVTLSGSHEDERLKVGSCLLNTLGFSHEDRVEQTYIRLDTDSLTARLSLSPFPDAIGYNIPLEHSPFCPARRVFQEIGRVQPTHKDIRLASTVVVESADGRFLLCRRDENSVIFPKVWVVPGGHVDPGEDIETACLRELREEVGIAVKRVGGHTWVYRNKKVLLKPLTMFESCYFEGDTFTLPKAQHLIVTFHLFLPYPAHEIEVTLDQNEIDMAVWITEEDLAAIRGALDGELDGLISDSEGKIVNFSQLAGIAPNDLGEGMGRAASLALDEVLRHKL